MALKVRPPPCLQKSHLLGGITSGMEYSEKKQVFGMERRTQQGLGLGLHSQKDARIKGSRVLHACLSELDSHPGKAVSQLLAAREDGFPSLFLISSPEWNGQRENPALRSQSVCISYSPRVYFP